MKEKWMMWEPEVDNVGERSHSVMMEELCQTDCVEAKDNTELYLHGKKEWKKSCR